MPVTREQQFAFLKNVVTAALASQAKWGVPASVTIAQAIDESEWGQSDLARQCNNFFGIKTAHLHGEPYQRFPTHEYINGMLKTVMADFRKYPSPIESFDDHGRLLATHVRYQPAMAVVDDPAAFALQLQACGYCTNKNYPGDLMRLVKQFDLTQYDSTPPRPPANAAKEVAA